MPSALGLVIVNAYFICNRGVLFNSLGLVPLGPFRVSTQIVSILQLDLALTMAQYTF